MKSRKGLKGSIPNSSWNGIYGIINVNAPTNKDEYNSAGAGLLLKNGFCVLITISIKSSVMTENINQLLWKVL